MERALEMCRLTGATLVIAKLDRLSRDAHFLLGLQKAGARFVAVDMPQANDLTVGIMALAAQEERKAISARTKAALGAAKARGVKLGGWRDGPVVDGARGAEANRTKADGFAASVVAMVRAMRDAGVSLRRIATEMDRKGVLTQRGGKWSADAVLNVLNRAGCLVIPPRNPTGWSDRTPSCG
jgi:DNA invertase Pin-like site-specific DNA recombinase